MFFSPTYCRECFIWRRSIGSFTKRGWDGWQADGGMALVDPTWGGSMRPEQFDGKYWMSYIGGAKQGYEPDPLAIGMAVSDDMVTWRRYGMEPVVDNAPGKPAISGDPQIVKIGDLWVMFYFGFRWKPAAFDTFAVSRDLVHWTKWDGPHLVEPSEPWDKTFAHKPWVLRHDGVVYHFYCAVGDQGSVIALAASKDLREDGR